MPKNLLLILLSILIFACNTNPCKKADCKNGGVCIEGDCQCPEGWGGKDCGTVSAFPTNPNPAQNIPQFENFIENGSNSISISQLLSYDISTFFAIAANSGFASKYSLQKLNNQGQMITEKEISYEAKSMMITNDGLLNSGVDGILVVGGSSIVSAPYSMYEYGKISFYDLNCNLISDITISEPNYRVSFRHLTNDNSWDETGRRWAAGVAIDNSGIQYPYLCEFTLINGSFQKMSSKVLTAYPKSRIMSVLQIGNYDQPDSTQPWVMQYDFILALNKYSGSNPSDCVMALAKPNYYDATWGWGKTTWLKEISGSIAKSYFTPNAMIYGGFGSLLLLCGATDDSKQPLPTNGGNWTSGIAVGFNYVDGVIMWKNILDFLRK